MQRITEEFYFDDETRLFRFHPAKKNGYVMEAGRYFSFEFCRKSTDFGGTPVDQFWLALDSIYGRRGVQPRNYEVLIELYWAQCMQALTVFDDDTVDSFILAKLLPYFRRHGSRRIFDDAILTSSRRPGERKYDLVRQLDLQLATSRHGTLDLETFHRKTNALLGRPDLSAEAEACYHELAEELLEEGRAAIGRWGPKDGIQASISKLEHWMRTFARRSGHEDRKLALDMLSYEARAAVHRCYSSVWYLVLDRLTQKYELDEASVQFHRLMHFDIQLPSNVPGARFHLFHGHVFGLHPGLSVFLRTRTGGELIGDYLRGNGGDRPLRQLLNGFCTALADYYVRSDEIAAARKRSSRDLKFEDLEEVAADQTKGRGRRR